MSEKESLYKKLGFGQPDLPAWKVLLFWAWAAIPTIGLMLFCYSFPSIKKDKKHG